MFHDVLNKTGNIFSDILERKGELTAWIKKKTMIYIQ